ncbi:hypothetical protein I4641_01105 [Waterburya agarophytonicola K14]|uniref:Uncharacterized protein n=1 Tax=Waterburya agarophytonicola KI4 TaxID=2874699 RepID=A0A964BLG7_9CYAN|nr:hypothetical protein [Waterburya agarophytonicola]MCC0175578.1 hypothetical protein [Waterburya agarophytonicola KI4]
MFACLGLVLSTGSLVNLQLKELSQKFSVQSIETYSKQENQQKTLVNFQKNLPTFGFDNLLADLNYLQFIQYFGDTEARNMTGYSLVTDYFELLVSQDPRFTNAYLSLSTANSLFAAQPEKTVELLDRVLESSSPNLPGYPFFLWTYKATDEILFLGDLEAAKNSYLMAANWASKRNDDLGNELSDRFITTAKFLASNPDSTEARVGAWSTLLNQAQDSKTQQYVIEQLEKLGAEVNITPDGRLEVRPPESDRA